MRRCPRSDEVRQSLAAEEPLAPDLSAHVAACADCTKASAAARRFDARLDAAARSPGNRGELARRREGPVRDQGEQHPLHRRVQPATLARLADRRWDTQPAGNHQAIVGIAGGPEEG